MKFLRELSEDVSFGTELNEATGTKDVYIEGTWMQSAIPNRNKRIYPEGVMEAAVNKYVTNYVKDDRGYGELGHPTGPTINPDRISHRIISLKKEGTDWVGKARINNNPMGKIAKGLMEDGGKIGVSSRGLGSLKENRQGIMEVQEDFFIATAGDIVIDPSAPKAFMNAVNEGADWILDPITGNWVAQNTLDRIVEETKTMSRVQIEENALRYFSNFMKTL